MKNSRVAKLPGSRSRRNPLPVDRHGNLNLLFGLALGCLGLQGTGLGAREAAVSGCRYCTEVACAGRGAAFTQRLNVVDLDVARQVAMLLFVLPTSPVTGHTVSNLLGRTFVLRFFFVVSWFSHGDTHRKIQGRTYTAQNCGGSIPLPLRPSESHQPCQPISTGLWGGPYGETPP